jgi:hypothetical protein
MGREDGDDVFDVFRALRESLHDHDILCAGDRYAYTLDLVNLRALEKELFDAGAPSTMSTGIAVAVCTDGIERAGERGQELNERRRHWMRGRGGSSVRRGEQGLRHDPARWACRAEAGAHSRRGRGRRAMRRGRHGHGTARPSGRASVALRARDFGARTRGGRPDPSKIHRSARGIVARCGALAREGALDPRDRRAPPPVPVTVPSLRANTVDSGLVRVNRWQKAHRPRTSRAIAESTPRTFSISPASA